MHSTFKRTKTEKYIHLLDHDTLTALALLPCEVPVYILFFTVPSG